MGRDDSDATTSKNVWNWDSTDSWTGNGQTGDACALYDTDGDGNINVAICVRVANTSPTTVVNVPPSPYVWTCNDGRPDRCFQPSGPLPYTDDRPHGHEPRRRRSRGRPEPHHRDRSLPNGGRQPEGHDDPAHGAHGLPAGRGRARERLLLPVGRQRRQQQPLRLHHAALQRAAHHQEGRGLGHDDAVPVQGQPGAQRRRGRLHDRRQRRDGCRSASRSAPPP